MAKLTRRGLLKQTAAGVATAGVVGGAIALAPRLTTHADAPATTKTEASTTTATERLVVLVENPSKGSGIVMVGEAEYAFNNPSLVNSLLSIAK